GQVADKGTVGNDHFEIAVQEVTKAPNGQNLHQGTVQFGQVSVNSHVDATVNKEERKDIQKNHSATHLLHAALKEILGEHVNQAGSLVESERLRFDFSHFGPMTEEEIDQVERRVNEEIWKGISVHIQEMPIQEAKEMGAMALFGEKYGDIVRVVNMAPFSIELCGGIHVDNTAEIGLFKIVSESGTGAGVRRIEALTGKAAFLYFEDIQNKFNSVKEQLKVKSDKQVYGKVVQVYFEDIQNKFNSVKEQLKVKSDKQVYDKVVQIQENEKQLNKQLEQRNKEITSLKMGNIEDQVEMINGFKVLATEVEVSNPKEIRQTMDDFKSKQQDTIIILASHVGEKVSLIAAV
ncbi:alanine--tRNA ligase, partial [Staphylococcus hominis]